MDVEHLRKLPLFRDLSNRELDLLARWTDEIDVPAGRHLMQQDAFAHEFMVIVSGTCEVTHDGNHLADLGPGEFFGEIALMEQHRRSATVTATSDLRIVVMHERDFRAMEDEIPHVARRIREVMEERRREHFEKTGEQT